MAVISASKVTRLLVIPMRPGVAVHADLWLPREAASARKHLVSDRTEVTLKERVGGRKTLRHTRYTYLGYAVNRRGAVAVKLSEVHGGGLRVITLARLLECGTVNEGFERGKTLAIMAAERKAKEGARA